MVMERICCQAPLGESLARQQAGQALDNPSHFIGAVCNPERPMVRDQSPVRRLCDLAETTLPAPRPVHGILTVNATDAMTRQEIEGGHFRHMRAGEASRRGGDCRSAGGWRRAPSGEETYYVANPATGLWAARESFDG